MPVGVETVHARLGIAVFPDYGVTAAALLDVADQRLVSDKRDRRPGRGARRAA